LFSHTEISHNRKKETIERFSRFNLHLGMMEIVE